MALSQEGFEATEHEKAEYRRFLGELVNGRPATFAIPPDENNQVDRDKIAKRVEEALNQDADQLVLGCTHYHWIEEMITDMAKGKARVLQPSLAVVAQLRRVLEQLA